MMENYQGTLGKYDCGIYPCIRVHLPDERVVAMCHNSEITVPVATIFAG